MTVDDYGYGGPAMLVLRSPALHLGGKCKWCLVLFCVHKYVFTIAALGGVFFLRFDIFHAVQSVQNDQQRDQAGVL